MEPDKQATDAFQEWKTAAEELIRLRETAKNVRTIRFAPGEEVRLSTVMPEGVRSIIANEGFDSTWSSSDRCGRGLTIGTGRAAEAVAAGLAPALDAAVAEMVLVVADLHAKFLLAASSEVA